MHGHLVTVKVGVKSRTGQRVKLNGFSFNKHRLKRLDTETMECWCTVENHRMMPGHFFQNVPDLWLHAFQHALRGFEHDVFFFHQLANNERFEKLKRHFFWQTTLV